MKRSHEIDMTQGPIFSKIVVFALPLMLTGILQLLFNAADVIVVASSPAAGLWPPWAPTVP